MFLSLLIVFYALSCADKTTTAARSGVDLVWPVPVVILICLRYCSILESGKSDGDPVEVVCKDKVLLEMIGRYAVIVLWLLYF
ncbi:MAG: hypothetical protein HFH41_06630 [Lachnospiraceae bacterium]|nr:hypothetical protein [Lachnospiraceae bacterium]